MRHRHRERVLEFLLARIADDERAAAAADGAGSARARDECESKRRIVELAYFRPPRDGAVEVGPAALVGEAGAQEVGDERLVCTASRVERAEETPEPRWET